MPSPLVLINSTAQINGVNVTDASTVTVSLASSSGVYAWDVTCIGTDELNTVDAINALLSINHSTNTATFTLPTMSGNGAALIFQSTVNNGTDVNNVVQSIYSTTFGVYVLATNGNRIGAQNETTEGDAVYGWLTKLNTLIRAS